MTRCRSSVLRIALLSMALVGCAPPVASPLSGHATTTTTTPRCDPAEPLDYAREAAARVAELQQQMQLERSIYVAQGAFDGAPLDCDAPPPAGLTADEHLFRTAVCAELAGRLRDATIAYEGLRATFRTSTRALRATRRVAALYAVQRDLRGAAARLEDYERMYAGERDAIDALADAIVFHGARGDEAARRADEREFAVMYGQKRGTADVFLHAERQARCRRPSSL